MRSRGIFIDASLEDISKDDKNNPSAIHIPLILTYEYSPDLDTVPPTATK
jgi:hypothetical protein